ncbi:MAG: DUF4058 domain-containing protein [Planctomycetaceae bacterium]|nr:DUF4058 domain-containing protein [Planctomycetaceae bacterium]
MPVHDWTRVSAGTFHDFHCSWIVTLKGALNDGLLPRGYYAQAEQLARQVLPDVITLQSNPAVPPIPGYHHHGVLAVADAPPRVAVIAEADEIDEYARKQQTLVIRHSSGDEVIALIEIVSRGNKQTLWNLDRFVEKAIGALFQGIHLLIADVIPPGQHDPQGIHGAIWDRLQSVPYKAPRGKPLTLAAYAAAQLPKAYVEPIAVGTTLPDMPLFIEEGLYVNAPLERTYREAYATVPERWRLVIEGRAD